MTQHGTEKEMKQTILILQYETEAEDNLRLVLTLAGFDVRVICNETEAINIVEMASALSEDIICLMVRCTGERSRTMNMFNILKLAQFSLPVLIVATEEHASSFRMIQNSIPEELKVHFCFANSTLDALTGIAV